MRQYGAAILTLSAAIISFSCTDRLNRPSGRPEQPPKTILVDKLFYSAVKYPDTCRWQDETSADNVSCEVLLADNDGLICSFKAGKGHDFSAESFNHKVLDGHLYDFRRADGRTWIRKDGEKFLDWEREEYVVDIISHNGRTHTLSSVAIGQDYRYRIDGNIELMGNSVGLESGFYIDRSHLIFNLAGSGTDPKTRPWYYVRDGELVSVVNQFDDMSIVSISMVNDAILTIGDSDRYNLSWLCEGKLRNAMLWPKGMKGKVKRFTKEGYLNYIEGSFMNDETSEDVSWINGGILCRPEKALRRINSCVSSIKEFDDGKDHSLWVLGKEVESGLYVIYHDGISIPLPEGYLPSPTPVMKIYDEVLYVSLVDENGRAALLQGDQVIPLGFNGYVDDMGVAQVEVLSKSEH